MTVKPPGMSVVIGLAGVLILGLQAGWPVALGVFLMIWSNNYSIARVAEEDSTAKLKQALGHLQEGMREKEEATLKALESLQATLREIIERSKNP